MRLFIRGIVRTTTSSLSNGNIASIPSRISVNSLPHCLASRPPLNKPANHHRHYQHQWAIPTSSISSGPPVLENNLVKSSALRHPWLVSGRSSLARREKGSSPTAARVSEISPSSNMARDCIDLTSDDELDGRALSLRNAKVNPSANTQKRRPGDPRPRTQDEGPQGSFGSISHPLHGSSNNDPILLDEEDEVSISVAPSTPMSRNHSFKPNNKKDATNDNSGGTIQHEHQNNPRSTNVRGNEDRGNHTNPTNSTAAPPTGNGRPIPPNFGTIVLGPGSPPPLYPDLPNFGGPYLVKDREGDIPPIWCPYEPREESWTPPPNLDSDLGNSKAPGSELDTDMEDLDPEEARDLRYAIAMSLEQPPVSDFATVEASSSARSSDLKPAFREDQLKKKKKQQREELLTKMHARHSSVDSARAVDGEPTGTMSTESHPWPNDGPPLQSIESSESPTRPVALGGKRVLVSATSKQISQGIRDDRTISASPISQSQLAPTSMPSDLTAFNLLTLNRQAMEAERLARLKRKREADEAASDNTRGRELARCEREESKTVSISPPPLRRAKFDGTSPQRVRGAGVVDIKAPAREIPRSQPPRQSDLELSKDSQPGNSQSRPQAPTSGSRGVCAPTSSNATYFPTGKVFQTFVEGFPSENTISFPQLIGPKESLTACLLSSFIWDFDWLLPHFATAETKFQFVMHAKWPAQRESLREDFRGINNVRLCFPPMDSIINCMHSKLMLLFYDASDMDMAMAMSMPADTTSRITTSTSSWQHGPRCRIVVPTANLTGSDWGVGSVMENTVFLSDLPIKGQTAAAPSEAGGERDKTMFQESLVAFLQAQTVPEDIIAKLEHFDFRNTAEYGFVHTIGGMHGGDRWHTTGLCGLGRTITELGLASSNPPEVNFVTSSLGSLNDEFMSAMYSAVQGGNGLTEHQHRTTGTSNLQLNLQRGLTKPSIFPGSRGLREATVTDKWRQNFRFFFPSDDTVKASIGGPAAAGTICFSDKWWQNARFPRQNLRDCISVRHGCLMHNKLIFVKYSTPMVRIQGGKTYVGWVYVGSANLSESAWGRLVHDRTTYSPKLNCRNWECGVVVPVEGEAEDMKSSSTSSEDDLIALSRIVPVPMKYPGESFGGRKPWLFSEDTTR